jgi:hypothetical protein
MILMFLVLSEQKTLKKKKKQPLISSEGKTVEKSA